MLYYKALLEGLADMPGADPEVRAAIEAEAQAEGWEALHRQLAEVDRNRLRVSTPTIRSD